MIDAAATADAIASCSIGEALDAAQPARRSVTVEAPASSANLGPGFDALALALDLHLRVKVTPLDHGAEQILVEGRGRRRDRP